MTYTKPEVLLLGRAVDAVQSFSKPGGTFDGTSQQTNPAYESDE
jgi:hypothetical protein